jgi:Deoxyribonuclease NucA/NucB
VDQGKPAELTRDGRENRRAKYAAACGTGNFTITYPGKGSCDEYPFASTLEGGVDARTEEVPVREQDCQGGTLSTAYRYQNITTGTKFLVVISNPDRVASGPFAGTDSAEDQSSCGS